MALILVVDDDVVFRSLVGATLSYSGHKVVQAKNGMEALTVFISMRPHLVVTDIQMPVRDGLGLISDIRQIADDVPIVAMTAGSTSLLKQAQEMGATLAVEKGENLSYVLEHVEELLKLS
jgi:CheY-like chemotaxis protein